MQRGAAEEALAQAGFDAFVSFAEESDPDDQACDDRPGVVWPVAGSGAQRDQARRSRSS
jgi:hypothetical protein